MSRSLRRLQQALEGLSQIGCPSADGVRNADDAEYRAFALKNASRERTGGGGEVLPRYREWAGPSPRIPYSHDIARRGLLHPAIFNAIRPRRKRVRSIAA